MTYGSLAAMYQSESLRARVTAAAALEGISDPDLLRASSNFWKVVARTPEWTARWHDATVNYTPVYNPDMGARPDVITDELIEECVQALKQQYPTLFGVAVRPPAQAAAESGEVEEDRTTVEELRRRGLARKAEGTQPRTPGLM